MNPAETRERFAADRRDTLHGAPLGYDAVMPESHRLLIEVQRWGTLAGGTALNYAEATDMHVERNQVDGVQAVDQCTGTGYDYSATLVVNAAGPGAAALAKHFTGRESGLFMPSLAWNLLVERDPLSDAALAVQSAQPGAQLYFLHALGGRMLIGTGHAPLPENSSTTQVSPDNIERTLNDVNNAIPGLDIRTSDVCRIFAGQLPVTKAGTTGLASVPAIVSHGSNGGPSGLFTISGVKYTTSRSTAERVIATLRKTVPALRTRPIGGLPPRPAPNRYQLNTRTSSGRADRVECAKNLIATESPRTLADLFMHRSDVINDPQIALELADEGCEAFGWDAEVSKVEIRKLKDYVRSAFIVK
jgi:glycerol-3-phosphate dehydrogenase